MHRRTGSLAAALVSAGLLALGGTACSDANAALAPNFDLSAIAGADFTGSWTLNEEASDLPPRGDGRHGQQPAGVRSGGGPDERGGPGGRGGPPPPMRSMTITQTDSTITVSDERHARVIFTDGRTETIALRDGKSGEILAGWDGATLVIQQSMEDGPSAVERWSLNEANQLVVAVEADGPMGEKTITLVYDRTE